MLTQWAILACVIVGALANGELDAQTRALSGGRIINGREARDGEFPYQVSLQRKYYESEGSYPLCGGVIIDEYHILTAGHCIFAQDIPRLVVLAGIRDLSATADPNRVNLTVEQAYLHQEYDDSYLFNDIALVRVSPGFPLDGKYIQPIPLLTEQLKAPATCIVSGWGNTRQFPDPYPNVLQALDLPFIDYDVCATFYEDYEPGYFIPGMLCAGYIEGEKDACDGDSGGPLAWNGQLAGLVSWGEDCAQPNYPGIYTDIAYYHDWIQSYLALSYEEAQSLGRRLK